MAYRAIAEHGVKTLHCAPSTLYMLIEYETRRGTDALTEMDYVFIGGEKLSIGRVRDWAEREGNRCTLLHQYGVAECTDVASSHVLADYSRYQSAALPAGPPVYNTEMWFLDEELREVRQGETGEICISGRSVSAGYLNAAPNELERFTEVELGGTRTRIYRTGDLGYATGDGEVVVVGRRDAQVKIRGMRMDLGDVEHAVRSMDSVHDVAVLALPDSDGELSLVAFVLPALPNFDPQQLRADLLTVLPRNMVPQEYLALEAFPLNPNGKVDRLALPKLRRS
jgi:acyl-coenzyme A synthetase/AMP-(fatty) acid ligase